MSKTVTTLVIILVVAVLLGVVIFALQSGTTNTNTTNANAASNKAANSAAVSNRNVNSTANANRATLNASGVPDQVGDGSGPAGNAATNANAPTNRNASNANTAITNTNSAPSASNEVSATRAGFSPKSLTVSAGEKVTWTNDDTIVHYVAPDTHPSHTKYRGVWDDDGSGRIASGETYSMTFSQAGTYTYHDHLDSLKTGTIVVE